MVVMSVVMLMLAVVVVVMMLVTAAIGIVALVVVMVVMSVVMLMLIMIVIVMMLMTAAIGIVALVIMVMMRMVMMLRRLGKARKLLLDRVTALHSRQKLCAVQLLPRCGDDRCGGVMLAQERHRVGDLLLVHTLCVRQHDATCVLYLVVEKLAEVLHVHLALFDVGNRGKAVQDHALMRNVLHGANNVRELADTRGLDQNTVGTVLGQNLLERLAEISHQRTTDTAAVHLGHFDPRVLHKAAVNADLAKLVLDQHQLLPRIRLFQQLLDQRGLTRPQKARKNINFRHVLFTFVSELSNDIIPLF